MTHTPPKPGSDGQKLAPLDDHARGCAGREYTCTCGYDVRKDALIVEAASRIEELQGERDARCLSWSPDVADMMGLLDGAADGGYTPDRTKAICASARQVLSKTSTAKAVAETALQQAEEKLKALEGPIDMVLFCPACGAQHVDEATADWANPPHRSHLCHGCGHIWRPADVATNGVAAITSRGLADSEIGQTTLREKLKEAMGALVEIADRLSKQVPATRAYLIDNGIDPIFADVLLSHYANFARLEGGSGKGLGASVAGLPSSQEGSDTQDQHSAGKED